MLDHSKPVKIEHIGSYIKKMPGQIAIHIWIYTMQFS